MWPTLARLAMLVLILGTGLPGTARSQEAELPRAVDAPASEPRFLINLRDATLSALAEQVSEITGRTLVLDPTVTGTVTVIAAQPLDRAAVWELFQSVLASNGYAALQSGAFWRVVPQGVVREGGGVVEDPAAQGRLDIITRLIPLRNVPVATAANALRPLVASFGYIEAIPESNTLIVTDVSENVRRLEALARTLDGDSEVRVYSLPLRNAVARDVAAALQAILSDPSSGVPPGLSVDDRANVILLRGTAEAFAEAERLVADLDVPGRPGPSVVPVTRVYPLRFAEAASLAEILSNLVSGGAATATNAVAAALPPAPGSDGTAAGDAAAAGEQAAPPPVLSLASEDISIQPDVASNAIVVRAREEVQADLAALIAQLDTRRPQVLIEAAIVEISGDVSEQLGIQLGLGSAAPPGGFAATSFPGSGPSLDGVLRLLGSPASAALAPAGVSIGLARGDRFGLLVQALGQSNQGAAPVHAQPDDAGQPARRDCRGPERALPHRVLRPRQWRRDGVHHHRATRRRHHHAGDAPRHRRRDDPVADQPGGVVACRGQRGRGGRSGDEPPQHRDDGAVGQRRHHRAGRADHQRPPERAVRGAGPWARAGGGGAVPVPAGKPAPPDVVRVPARDGPGRRLRRGRGHVGPGPAAAGGAGVGHAAKPAGPAAPAQRQPVEIDGLY